jgi:CHASE3 domain sensor protein
VLELLDVEEEEATGELLVRALISKGNIIVIVVVIIIIVVVVFINNSICE